jgi:hypothetical protein
MGCIPNGMQFDRDFVFLPSVTFLVECCSNSNTYHYPGFSIRYGLLLLDDI